MTGTNGIGLGNSRTRVGNQATSAAVTFSSAACG